MLLYINIYTAIQEHMSEVCRTQTQNPSERTGSFAGIHSRGVPSVTYSCTTSTTTSTTHTNGTLVHVRISTAVPVLAD